MKSFAITQNLRKWFNHVRLGRALCNAYILWSHVFGFHKILREIFGLENNDLIQKIDRTIAHFWHKIFCPLFRPLECSRVPIFVHL